MSSVRYVRVRQTSDVSNDYFERTDVIDTKFRHVDNIRLKYGHVVDRCNTIRENLNCFFCRHYAKHREILTELFFY